MKIDNKNLFLVDVYRAVYTDGYSLDLGGGVSIGGNNYRKEIKKENVACIKVAHMYVPLEYVNGLFDYLEVMSHKESDNSVSNPDRRFLATSPRGHGYGLFVENIRPLFKESGKTKLKDLKSMCGQNQLIVTEFVDKSNENEIAELADGNEMESE